MLALSLLPHLDGYFVENDFPAVLAAHWWTRSQNNYVEQNQKIMYVIIRDAVRFSNLGGQVVIWWA
jgi:hypothetical protein